MQDLQTGEEIYNNMQHAHIQPDIALYNSILYFFVKCGIPHKAISLWEQIQKNRGGPTPNITTYTNVLMACGGHGALGMGKSLHNLISKRGLLHDPTLESTLIKMYADCGR